MLSDAEILAHVERLNHPATPLELVRPCTLGDGVLPAGQARPPDPAPLRFVPASGASTRMFRAFHHVNAPDLSGLREQAARDPAVAPALRALSGWSELALSRELTHVDPAVDLPATVQALIDSGLASSPKALVPFHLDGATAWRSALEGHLREAARAGEGARAHLTAPATHLEAFRERVQATVDRVARDTGVRVHVELSIQHPDTDTPAIDPAGQVIRREDGSAWLRPGGHGALLRNLDALSGLVRIINIDNVAHTDHRDALRPWGDHLVRQTLSLRDARDEHLRRVRAGQDLPQARDFLRGFGLEGPVEPRALESDLDRPIRVCAVVPNDGQPGGGPFWVRDGEGRITAQIVESVEVDHDDPAQAAIWAASTHFNPVDIVCWLDDAAGQPHDLQRYVDDRRWIRTRKRHGGVEARCLERPGLWNGSMSGWLTHFIAVPRQTFNPVKTVADLLGERHRPAAR